MKKTHMSNATIGKRAQQLYEQTIRSFVETEENIGKIVVLNVETGEYEVDRDGITAHKRFSSKHPATDPYSLFAIRIGYDAVYTVGGTLTKTVVPRQDK